MAMTLREFIVFALVILAGSFVGSALVDILKVNQMFGGGVIATALTFIIPLLVIYIIWKQFGEKMAE
ncbi:MAG: hypothetical protein QXH59_09680 [Candidatus Caldarchaeum sp.]